MTSSVRQYSDNNEFHYKLEELGTKPKGKVYQYIPNTGDINTVKSNGKIAKLFGWSKPGTANQAQSVDAIGKLIAKHILFLDKELDLHSLIGLKSQIEQLHLTENPLYEDLDLLIRIMNEDTSSTNSVWEIISPEVRFRLLNLLTPEEMTSTAKANREFAAKILEPIKQSTSVKAKQPMRPKIDFDENVESIFESGLNLDLIRNVYYPLLEMPAIKNRVETLANSMQEYYRPTGKATPEQINPKFAGFNWNDLALLEMKIRGQPLFEATP